MVAQQLAFDAREVLRDSGLRVTAPRVAVLDVVHAHPHCTADLVAREVRTTLGAVSTQAVYDVLRACMAAGILRRIEPAGSAARYETRAGDNHHHMVCRSCSRVFDVDCTVGAAPCLDPGDEVDPAAQGFIVDEAEVVFWGQCLACVQAAEVSTEMRSTAI